MLSLLPQAFLQPLHNLYDANPDPTDEEVDWVGC